MEFDKGRVLTPEEIDKIRHTITPIERIPKEYRGKELYITAPKAYNPRKSSDIDKL